MGLPAGQERYFEAMHQLAAEGQMSRDSVVTTSRESATEIID